jgi:hypothetical protein
MASPLTLRLDEKTRERVRRIARRKGMSASAVIRRAVITSLDREEALTPPTAFESIRDLVGCVRGGKANRSTATGRQVARLLRERRRGR